MNRPAVPDSFEWFDAAWGPALRCRPLAAVAPHLFTTRLLPLSSPADWQAAAAAVGATRVETLEQVHGREVVVLKAGTRPAGDGRRADAFVSNDPGVAVAVRAADCVPLLIADPRTGAVAAVHAGWRGTAAGAAAAAVDALERAFGARPADLVAAIGPSIGPCCYEVGPELVDAFAAAGHARHLIDRWFLAPPPRRGPLPPLGAGAPRLRLDVAGATRDQLQLAGLAEERIHACGLCTADHLELFPSFRREREGAGRLAGVIRPA